MGRNASQEERWDMAVSGRDSFRSSTLGFECVRKLELLVALCIWVPHIIASAHLLSRQFP